jgi:hypothetical protein
MDIRTGRTYESIDDARRDGVPESDIAFVDRGGQPHFAKPPKIAFTKGSFKPIKATT